MSASEPFFDTNVLIYLLSGDSRKADRSEALLEAGGVVSVQVLNEFASVALKKLKISMPQVRQMLATFRSVCRVVPITESIHVQGMEICARHQLSLYDAMIVAAALEAGSSTLYSEDLQHGRLFRRSLRILNPF